MTEWDLSSGLPPKMIADPALFCSRLCKYGLVAEVSRETVSDAAWMAGSSLS